MIKKTAYILIGDDKTGKTSFQKYLILHLCGEKKFVKLNTNLIHNVIHPESPRKLKTLFTMNRSIQEKMGEYKSVENYFNKFFKDADICILSSHSHGACINDIEKMIEILKSKYYNVEAVFFTNHLNTHTSDISKLSWNGRNIIENPNDVENWNVKLEYGAKIFGDMIIRYAKLN
ncbi:hypothetical protein [Elizabethkingia anophelis]|jgi:hypothetical protein|uniref:hypothetical protein n=1 Tax=Elizabethkingia anophelis TaxID=1117645 RepID=UPI000442BFF6|nr:hypothetical protein [Elizabethkingia anophelis]MCT3668196.1 hypothetical protein [Elizabethkingia anophelis]MCT4011803.1 hypothetical protein [Elizabethkingia anophelis]MDV3897214.1 hypothetical protein [Elizabethkingia anophelis]OPC49620.1 hypothetical protein BAY06_10875 [Elizabethkingia anophelis]CDN75747.1 conserved hypothetical protein [Elizabethkingia anophelis]